MKRFALLTAVITSFLALPSCSAAEGLAKALGRTVNTAGGLVPR